MNCNSNALQVYLLVCSLWWFPLGIFKYIPSSKIQALFHSCIYESDVTILNDHYPQFFKNVNGITYFIFWIFVLLMELSLEVSGIILFIVSNYEECSGVCNYLYRNNI